MNQRLKNKKYLVRKDKVSPAKRINSLGERPT